MILYVRTPCPVVPRLFFRWPRVKTYHRLAVSGMSLGQARVLHTIVAISRVYTCVHATLRACAELFARKSALVITLMNGNKGKSLIPSDITRALSLSLYLYLFPSWSVGCLLLFGLAANLRGTKTRFPFAITLWRTVRLTLK